jgi:ribosomal protein S8
MNVGNKTYKEFIIYLKYDEAGSSVIRSISNISKPSRKIYVATQSL